MKIVLLVAGSRAGAEFFQSLLDGSHQVCQFPGWIQYDKKFKEILNLRNPEEIAESFLKNYSFYFNSCQSSHERHNQLGKTKNQYYVVDQDKFKSNFIELISKEKLSNFNIFKFLHLAYAKTNNQDIFKIKILLANIHLVKYCQEFVKDFNSEEGIEIVHTIRNPLSGVGSPVNNWLKYKNGSLFKPSSFIYHFNLVVNGISDLVKLKKEIRIIQLEKLHRENLKIMKEFCEIYDLEYIDHMKESTFLGKLWWGDAVSGKDLNGVNQNFKISVPEKLFFKKDIQLLEKLTENIIKVYQYEFIGDRRENIFFFLPMKIELLVMLNSLKNFKFFDFLTAPYFWFKRIKILLSARRNNIKMPYTLGS